MKNKIIPKVLCITPPFSYGNYADIGSKSPNLGLALIAAYLEKNNINVEILDAFALDLNMNDIKTEIIKRNPTIIFVGSVTATHQTALNIITIAKELNKNIKIIIGGPHVSNVPDSAFPQADYAVLHEGEETALELTKVLLKRKKKKISKIKGIAYWNN